ncbi:MAG: hypothetical protein AAFO91_16875 [Bacteroidota bacterium]
MLLLHRKHLSGSRRNLRDLLLLLIHASHLRLLTEGVGAEGVALLLLLSRSHHHLLLLGSEPRLLLEWHLHAALLLLLLIHTTAHWCCHSAET